MTRSLVSSAQPCTGWSSSLRTTVLLGATSTGIPQETVRSRARLLYGEETKRMVSLVGSVVESSVMMKGTTIWKGRMNTAFAHCLMRMDGNVVNVGRRHERSLHINVTHRGNARRTKGVASLVVTNQCFWCRSTHVSIESTAKHMAAVETHNRCVVDAGRFTQCAHDVISPYTTRQNSSATMEYPPPKGHA